MGLPKPRFSVPFTTFDNVHFLMDLLNYINEFKPAKIDKNKKKKKTFILVVKSYIFFFFLLQSLNLVSLLNNSFNCTKLHEFFSSFLLQK